MKNYKVNCVSGKRRKLKQFSILSNWIFRNNTEKIIARKLCPKNYTIMRSQKFIHQFLTRCLYESFQPFFNKSENSKRCLRKRRENFIIKLLWAELKSGGKMIKKSLFILLLIQVLRLIKMSENELAKNLFINLLTI